MTEQPGPGRGSLSFVVLCVADATRWLAWSLMRLLVQWGSALYAVQVGSEGTAYLPRPRALRRDISTRREVRRGLAELDAYLSATALAADASHLSDGEVHHPHPEGADG